MTKWLRFRVSNNGSTGASLSNLRPLRPRQLGDIDGDAPRFVVNYQLIT